MQTKIFEIPTLYGDHHVIEIRRILLEIPGVVDVYASSCFQMVEVTYDETQVNDLELAVKLDNAGYLGEWTIPMEVGVLPPSETIAKPFFRHTEVYETSKQVVGFSQNVAYNGRPLWPCPGMGSATKPMEE
jgi:copper chaperone CopZ